MLAFLVANVKNSLVILRHRKDSFSSVAGLFTSQSKASSNPVYVPVNEEAEEILENYYVPGRYQHFLRKNRRTLKKEARQESYFGREPVQRKSAREARASNSANTEEKTVNINGEEISTFTMIQNSSQRNLSQRLNRAIIKCNDRVPHAFLSSTFMRIVNITISPNLRVARIWWKPEGQKGISKDAIESCLRKNLEEYCSMLQRSMYVRKSPKIIFVREDLKLQGINEILDQIEDNFKKREEVKLEQKPPENLKDYLARLALYERPIWQCILTGKQSLTYKQALESENNHREALKDKFPEGLKEQILRLIQFKTDRLDVLVNEIFQEFKDLYAIGEIVYVVVDKRKIKAKILEVIYNVQSDINSKGVKSNGFKPRKISNSQVSYRVQILDEEANSAKQKNKKLVIKTINGSDVMSRADKLSFTKTLVRQFIKETANKDSYYHAPWLVKLKLAKKYGISTKLPDELQQAKVEALEKSRKRKSKSSSNEVPMKKSKNNKGTSVNVRATKGGASANKKSSSKTSKQSSKKLTNKKQSKKQPTKSAAEKARQEKKKQQELEKKKKEAERQAAKEKKQKEKEEQKRQKAEQKKIKYPIEDLEVPLDRSLRQKRPSISQDFKVPQKYVGTMLVIWNFFNIFGKSLGMSFCTLDDFESSLYHNVVNPRCYLTIEMHVVLLNAIIKDRLHSKGKKRQVVARVGNLKDNPKNESDSDPMDVDQVSDSATPDASRKILEGLGQNWDKRTLSSSDGRKGWESILVGCIHQLGDYESIPNLDRTIAHMVPDDESVTEEDFEENYVTLEVVDKLQILNFLVNVATKTVVIHDYIERCVEKLADLNKEKSDLAKEKRQIALSFAEIAKGNLPPSLAKDSDDERSPSTSAVKSNGNGTETLESRKRKLEEDEVAIQKREDQIEKEKRKYSVPRVSLLGRDRFYNKYYYFDNVGAAVTEKYGAGRIFVESPNNFDLEIMTERELQRFNKRRKVEEISGRNAGIDNQTQWGYYDEISQIEELRQWLNSKGIRELSLNSELTSCLQELSSTMGKRQQDMVTSRTSQEVRRSKRTQATLAMLSAQPYMKWVNKLIK
ncbi:14689_t:CDS:10 [Acaulospora morrowiae]|uniref:14689_t:CDS:1 n=1 Tax=Acaulospora morrowiae TaxID=94023 RepID=A0A9N8W8K9_9GLOM|nr:14689_t:CDS:10 [Acaulospora morrowiae]